MISETITIATGTWTELQCKDTERRKDESGMPNRETGNAKCRSAYCIEAGQVISCWRRAAD